MQDLSGDCTGEAARESERMKRIPFVIWLLCYPVADTVTMYLAYLCGRVYPDWVWTASATMNFCIWTGVAFILWNDRSEL